MIAAAMLTALAGEVGCGIATDLVKTGGLSATRRLTHALRGPSAADLDPVLRATHQAYVDAMRLMAQDFMAIALSDAEKIAASTFTQLVGRTEFTAFRQNAEHIPIAALDTAVDDLFGADTLTHEHHAGIALADLVSWGVATPDSMVQLFERGIGEAWAWRDRFRAAFLAAMAQSPPGYQAFSVALLGEIKANGRTTAEALAALRTDLGAVNNTMAIVGAEIIATLTEMLTTNRPGPEMLGLTALGTAAPTHGFKAFLNNAVLPYFSREEFDRSHSRGAATAARAWFAGRTSDNHAVLIYGPGGVGKTRLALEICQAHAADGWHAWYVERHATVDSIAAHFLDLEADARTILLIDYGETAADLAPFASLIGKLAEGRDLRLVVTCRASAVQPVRDALVDLRLSEHPIGLLASSVECDYAAWVVDRILDHVAVPDGRQVAKVCDNLPVLAAFAAFLYQSHPALFDEQFRALLDLRDFSDWVTRRLSRLPVEIMRAADDGALAQIFAALPALQNVLRRHCAEQPRLATILDQMIADRWIEAEGAHFVAAHDVFADAIIARFVFAMPGVEADRIVRLLQGEIDDETNSVAIALDRLATGAGFDRVDDTAIVERLLSDGAGIARFGETLLNGRLLNHATRLDVMIGSAEIREIARLGGRLDGMLSRLAEWIADLNPAPDNVADIRTLLAPLLDAAITRSLYTNIVLRRAYELDPHRYSAQAIASIRSFPHADQSHFLLVAMVKREEDPAPLRADVFDWLNFNAGSPSASFVMRSWLLRMSDGVELESYVVHWLNIFGQDYDACWIIQSALQGGVSPAAVWPYLTRWLGWHRASEWTWRLSLAWMIAAPDKQELLSDRMIGWLTSQSAQSGLWSHYLTVLENPTIDFAPLIDAFSAWLETHDYVAETGRTLTAWLERSGSTNLVDRAVRRWFDQFYSSSQASFTIIAWLRAGGDPRLASRYMPLWLAQDHDYLTESFMLAPWLAVSPDDVTAQAAAFEWLSRNWQHEEAKFVIKHVERLDAIPDATILDISRWASAHPGSDDIFHRLTPIFRYLQSSAPATQTEGYRTVLLAIWDAIDIKEGLANWTHGEVVSAGITIGKLISRYPNDIGIGAAVRLIICKVVRTGAVVNAENTVRGERGQFGADNSLRYSSTLVAAVLSEIRAGRLSVTHDRHGLAQFAAWVAGAIVLCELNRGHADVTIQRLRAVGL